MTDKIKTSAIQSGIVSYIIEHGESTAYAMSRDMQMPWKTVKYNLDCLYRMGVVMYDGKNYYIDPRYMNDAFINGIRKGLEDIFCKFEDGSMTAEGVLYFIQYVVNHTKLRFRNGDTNGHDRGSD